MAKVKEDSWDSTQSGEGKDKSSTSILNKEEVVKSKRLFGMIKGTLNSLKGKTEGDKKREKVQEKLLEKLNNEKKEMQEKLDQEISEKKFKVLQSRKKEDVARLEKLEEFIELYCKKLQGFNHTVTEPRIYFKPREHSKKSRENLEKCCKNLEKLKIYLKEYMEKEYPDQDMQSLENLEEGSQKDIQDSVMQEA